MAKFKADRAFKDLKKGVVHNAGDEFEMSLARVEEVKSNIKANYNVDIKFFRLDADDEKQTDENADSEDNKEERADEVKETKETKGSK